MHLPNMEIPRTSSREGTLMLAAAFALALAAEKYQDVFSESSD